MLHSYALLCVYVCGSFAGTEGGGRSGSRADGPTKNDAPLFTSLNHALLSDTLTTKSCVCFLYLFQERKAAGALEAELIIQRKKTDAVAGEAERMRLLVKVRDSEIVSLKQTQTESEKVTVYCYYSRSLLTRF